MKDFNYEEYTRLMDEFLMSMKRTKVFMGPEITEILAPICRFLRVSCAELFYYESGQDEKAHRANYMRLYENGMVDRDRTFVLRETTTGGQVVVYILYQMLNDENWSDFEYKKIELLTNMLFSFNGRVRMDKLCENLMFYDRDMGIPNTRYMVKYSQEMIEKGEIGKYAACYFNIKRFAVINQMLGRGIGDLVMKKYIQGLSEMLSKDEFVFRMGGDNFGCLFYKEKLEKIKKYLISKTIMYDDEKKEKIIINSSAGYYMIPDNCRVATDIMDRISAANGVAKNVLKESFVFYNEEIMHHMTENKMLEDLFPEAIKNEEFQVYYQPKVNLKNYKIKGAEALCRWLHNGELLAPCKFIPLLEQSKAICILDFYMLEHVCKDIRNWLDEGREIVKVSVNLSRRHFGDVDLLEHIIEIIDRYKVPHKYIEIELTETTTDIDFKDLKRIVYGLKKAGISTSVDDFGIGYSSLNLIRELPWNVLKIDKSFLNMIDDRAMRDNIMLKHIISLAQDLGLECIVEGVETVEQVKLLKESNCFMAQGFYFDKPLPKSNFEERLNYV